MKAALVFAAGLAAFALMAWASDDPVPGTPCTLTFHIEYRGAYDDRGNCVLIPPEVTP